MAICQRVEAVDLEFLVIVRTEPAACGRDGVHLMMVALKRCHADILVSISLPFEAIYKLLMPQMVLDHAPLDPFRLLVFLDFASATHLADRALSARFYGERVDLGTKPGKFNDDVTPALVLELAYDLFV